MGESDGQCCAIQFISSHMIDLQNNERIRWLVCCLMTGKNPAENQIPVQIKLE
jgi:hypothetical protein